MASGARPKGKFSANQLKKAEGRRCKACVTGGQPQPSPPASPMRGPAVEAGARGADETARAAAEAEERNARRERTRRMASAFGAWRRVGSEGPHCSPVTDVWREQRLPQTKVQWHICGPHVVL